MLCAHAACHENELSDSMEGSPAYTVLNFHDFSVPLALLLKKKKKKITIYSVTSCYPFFPLHLSEYFSLIWFVINLALFIVSVLCYNMPSKVLNLRKMPCIYYIAAFGIIMELACIAQIVTGGIVTLWNCGKASNRKTSTF